MCKTKVCVVLPRGNAVKYVLQRMCGTHVMNFVTSTGLYILFPVSTVDYRYVNFFAAQDGRSLEVFQKFIDHGYTLSTLEDCFELDEQNQRCVGDESTRFFPFGEEEGVESYLKIRFSVWKRGVRVHDLVD